MGSHHFVCLNPGRDGFVPGVYGLWFIVYGLGFLDNKSARSSIEDGGFQFWRVVVVSRYFPFTTFP